MLLMNSDSEDLPTHSSRFIYFEANLRGRFYKAKQLRLFPKQQPYSLELSYSKGLS